VLAAELHIFFIGSGTGSAVRDRNMILKVTCEQCGKEFESDGFSVTEHCPHCGLETRGIRSGSSAPPQEQQTAVQPSKESVFFQNGGITVTNARFVVGAKTFAMRSITSVEVVSADEFADPDPKNPLPALTTGIGFVIIATGLGFWLGFDFSYMVAIILGVIGILLIFGGACLFAKKKRTFTIVLKTAGGEVAAYKSDDQNHIAKIIQALNDSIIAQA
jgi:predicted RNA-binding Zn-ribbon protein involved in translation (DUF1610 family)